MNKEDIKLVGSGWSSAAFVKNIDTDKYNVTVISITSDFIYTPLLSHQIITKIDTTRKINDLGNIDYIEARVTNIDFGKNKLICDDGKEINYENLILAHGTKVNTFNIEGVNENCFFLKTSNDADIIRNKLQSLPDNSNITVIGCGLTGSEIIGNLIDYNKFTINVIDGLPKPLTVFDEKIQNYTENLWKNNGVNTQFNNFVSKVEKDKVSIKNVGSISSDLTIWCGGIGISPLSRLVNSYLGLECRFGIPINNYLAINTSKFNNIYAMGDCAYSNDPPTAQKAYQQGKYLADCFNNDFNNIKPFEFHNRGQIGYIGKGESVFQLGKFHSYGKITGMFNKFVHLYNSIDYKQFMNFHTLF
uniref:NADH:ubiquinone reductase (non-electrogenic) n=1 Tax=viral metagenome TaxID=1070528 RepID=A0A6C0M135_9ZZZZ